MGNSVKIGLCGYFDNQHTIANGQTLRTFSITEQLKLEIGKENITVLDYSEWKNRPIHILLCYIKLLCSNDTVILFPDENAVRLIIPLALFVKLFHHTKIYYNVIGGWLPIFVSNHKYFRKFIIKLDGLFVQTFTLRESLLTQGIENIDILPNFRILDYQNLKYSQLDHATRQLKLCYLSRIEEPKGFEEMIKVVKDVNSNSIKCTLDIYGPIQKGYESIFDTIKGDFPAYIRYCGVLDWNQINNVLCNYDIQLFPTKYRTEGFPGSVLDSFYAGVPVLASAWNSARDIFDDGVNGLLFEFENYIDMKSKLELLINDRGFLNTIKIGSREEGQKYTGGKCIKVMLDRIMS